jgi:hypothetical protein
MARGSLAELGTQIELATSMELMSLPETAGSLLSETDRVLQGLIRSLEAKN